MFIREDGIEQRWRGKRSGVGIDREREEEKEEVGPHGTLNPA